MKVIVSGYDIDNPGSEDLLYAFDTDNFERIAEEKLEPFDLGEPVEKSVKSSETATLACGNHTEFHWPSSDIVVADYRLPTADAKVAETKVDSAAACHACQLDSVDALCGAIGGARTRVPEHVDCPQCLSLSNILILNHLQPST